MFKKKIDLYTIVIVHIYKMCKENIYVVILRKYFIICSLKKQLKKHYNHMTTKNSTAHVQHVHHLYALC